jgi:aminoglycoside phosphotransferase (APT) family kinase protein
VCKHARVPEWDAEYAIDDQALWRAAGTPPLWRRLGTGWDADAWLADEAVVWRMARRRVGGDALAREARVMPLLAPRLPAPVPVVRVVDAPGLPVLTRHAIVPGHEPSAAQLRDATPAFGAALGAFLRALHDSACVAAVGEALPRDPLGRADPAKRIEMTQRRLADVAALVDVAPFAAIVAAAAGPPLACEAVCHGDLHVRHALVDTAVGLAGVIDWGDVCVGAPAMDFALVTALPEPARHACFAAYGREPRLDEWRHARLLGVMFGASLLAADPHGASGEAAREWLTRLTL